MELKKICLVLKQICTILDANPSQRRNFKLKFLKVLFTVYYLAANLNRPPTKVVDILAPFSALAVLIST